MASRNPSSHSSATGGTETQNGQDGPVQLVYLDEEGNPSLNEEVLSHCLEQGGVEGAPVCVVSIIGEQRRGKSFLMNCLMRQLQNPDAADNTLWMCQEDEALGRFQCLAGNRSVTKGVWMCGQPLWIQVQGRKVAVFLVDTEGCLDLQRNMETSVKLSLFSILLSSYWIFNISNTFTRTEADYLEVFVHIAEEVGKTCNLSPVQRLDLLVRDWQLSRAYGAAGGQEYLNGIIQTLEGSAEQPRVLAALRATGTRCYVLPHPGTGFTRSTAGTLADTDEDFRQWLGDYVTSVVGSAGTHVRTDRAGQAVSQDLKTKRYDFFSPMKMAESLAAMRQEKENSRAVTAARKDYEEFVQQLDYDHQSMSSCLSVEPAAMERRLGEKRREVLGGCWARLQGEAPQRQAAREELEEELDRQLKMFLRTYEKHYEVAKVEAMTEANRRTVTEAWREYELFVQELDCGHQSMWRCLRVKPAEMQRRLVRKRWELQDRCQEQLLAGDPYREVALQELQQLLAEETEGFLALYKQRYAKLVVQLGQCMGMVSLSVVGWNVGAVAGACLTAKETEGRAVVIHVLGLVLGAIGGSLGSQLGAWLAAKVARYLTGTNAAGQGAPVGERERHLDQEPLLWGGTGEEASPPTLRKGLS
ncbi:RING finger protein 112-like isoform X2 [Carettochelys insculpta]|uniref:RING finger protein 112-like isoform X2 n=1 Tax=Carettochelys insculpta TaxID=44489 RepID=UPI003EC149E7